MKTFHFWPDWLLGSTLLSDPYQTASARPGPPALIQGKTLTASPVPVEPSLTCTGGVQLDHPLAALAALTKTWRSAGLLALIFQTTYRLRAGSMESTENGASGPGMPTDAGCLVPGRRRPATDGRPLEHRRSRPGTRSG